MFVQERNGSIVVSLYRALDEIDNRWREYGGVIVPGSWPGKDEESVLGEAIELVRNAKEGGVPFLGICMGMQAIVLMEGGKLKELSDTRVGIRDVRGWWGERMESHWHRFSVEGVPNCYDIYETDGVPEILRLRGHQFFVGTQFHPEYGSYLGNEHPLLVEFINICKKHGR